MTEIVVREEQPDDQGTVYKVNEAAFGQKDEADIVDAVRASGAVRLSLVALDGEKIVGHVLFSPVTVKNNPDQHQVLGLGPIAVLPGYQGKGIGQSLIRASLEKCREHDIAAVVLLGHTSYYPRFGFEPASDCDLTFRGEDTGDSFMVLELIPGATTKLSGAVHYVSAFD